MKKINLTTVEEVCDYIPEKYCRDDTYIKEMGIKLNIELDIPEKIEVLKCAVFGSDNKLYTWYFEIGESLEPMFGEFYQKLKIVCGGRDPYFIAKSNSFTIEEGEYELMKLYNEKGELV